MRRSTSQGEKDLGEAAAKETRLNTIQAYVHSGRHLVSHLLINGVISARKSNQQQLLIDILDVWIPATGAGLLDINEGALGIFGCVTCKSRLIRTTADPSFLLVSFLLFWAQKLNGSQSTAKSKIDFTVSGYFWNLLYLVVIVSAMNEEMHFNGLFALYKLKSQI